jgi:hypothetical protein
MTRITKLQSDIVNAHIEAKKTNNFTATTFTSMDNMREQLLAGKTSNLLLEAAEIRYCPIPSIIMSNTFDYESKAYIAGVRKGFKLVFKNLNIK